MINITNMMMISTKLKNITAATIPTKVTEAIIVTNLSESPATALVSWRWGGGSDSFS